AVILCYLTAVAAGSTDGKAMADQIQAVSGPPGTKYTWEQLPQAVKALENGDDIDYEGASGPININDAGDATAGVYDLYQFKNGTPVTIGEQPVVAARGCARSVARGGRRRAEGASPRPPRPARPRGGRCGPCRRGRARRPWGRAGARRRGPRSAPGRGRARSRGATWPARGARSARP